MTAENRRHTGRVDILGDLQGEIMVFAPMTITQVSPGGAQLETPFPLPLGSLHELRLTLGDASVVVKGRIVHSSISDVEQEIVVYRSGVEFVEPADRVAEVIANFVRVVTTDRAGEGGEPERDG